MTDNIILDLLGFDPIDLLDFNPLVFSDTPDSDALAAIESQEYENDH